MEYKGIMFDDVDMTITELLEKELSPSIEFDISFSIPDKSFKPISSSKSTINCYLYHIIEDRGLRSNEPRINRTGDSKIERIPPPTRVKLTYCITAWSAAQSSTPDSHAVKDEHRLLGLVLQVLLKYPVLPKDVLMPSLAGEDYPLPTTTIMPNGGKDPWDFWTAIGGQLRPSLQYNVTIAMPYLKTETITMVRERKTTYQQKNEPCSSQELFQIGGQVIDTASHPVTKARVTLEQTGKSVNTGENGYFSFTGLSKRNYTLFVQAKKFQPKKKTIKVPDPDFDYNIKLEPKNHQPG